MLNIDQIQEMERLSKEKVGCPQYKQRPQAESFVRTESSQS